MAYTKDYGSGGWKGVYDALKERIENGGLVPGEKLPTEAHLVSELGVSKMTIHRALRELANSGLVRRVERVGTFVADAGQPAAKKVGLVLPANQGYLELRLLSGISEALGQDRQMVLYSTANDSVTEYEAVVQAEKEVDGILVMPTCHPKTSQLLQRIFDQGRPVVCIDREPANTRLPSVTADNYAISRQGLAYLAQLGHRRVVYFGQCLREVSTLVERRRAFEDFMREGRYGDPDDLTRSIEPHSPEDLPLERRLYEDAMFRLLSGPDPVTAAFCANEHYLGVLLEACQGLPSEALERFEIVSFCDWPSLSFPIVRTHVIRQDARAIGLAAASLMVRALDGDAITPQRTEIPSSFHVSPDRQRTARQGEDGNTVQSAR